MKHRFIPTLLAILMLFCASPAALAYSDTDDSWAVEVIEKASQYGLMKGYPDGRFGVKEYLSRAEFVTALGRIFNWDPITPETPSFLDCDAKKWYYSAVETARLHGAIPSEGIFRPEDDISREEITVMIVRALGYGTLAEARSGKSPPFTDVKNNLGYIALAYEFGLIGGVQAGNQLQFRPSFSAYREEAAAILVRTYERVHSKVDYLHGFYAFSSYAQIDLTDKMDGVSVGWAQMEYDPATGPRLNSTAAGGNDWIKPQDTTPATSVFTRTKTPYNLNIYASAGNKITLADGSVTSTVAAVTGTKAARTAAIAAIVAVAPEYAGITIDFEALRAAHKAPFLAFMTELSVALDKLGKTLYVCVQPDTWYDGFDYRGLGEVSDKVILMAHDYQPTSLSDSYVGLPLGEYPVTPFPAIYEALRAVTDPTTGVQDHSKLALAISFGTAGFHIDQNGNLLETTIYHPAQDTLTQRLAQTDTVISYSPTNRNPSATYTTEDGNRYRVWFENPQSVTDKLTLARMFGITGVSLWRLGTIPASSGYDVWSAILSQR